MATINGADVPVHGKPLDVYLAESGYEPTHIAIEYNGAILPRAQYAGTILRDEDVVEIVRFVGGG